MLATFVWFHVRGVQRMEKTLPVQPLTVGKPAEGYQLAKITVNPTVISLRGPKSLLEKAQAIFTQPIDLTGKNRSFLEKVPLKLEAGLGAARARKTRVAVLVTLEEHRVEKRLENVALQAIREMEDKRVLDTATKKVSLWVAGPEETLELLKSEEVTAFVEVSRLKAGKFELPVQVNLPNGVKLVRVEPSQVEVHLTEN